MRRTPRARVPRHYRRGIRAHAGALVLLLAQLPVLPLAAQPAPSSFRLCAPGNGHAVTIGACSGLIESGLLPVDKLVSAFILRGHANFATGRFNDALADYIRAITLHPDRAAYHRYAGDARANILRGSGDNLAIAEQLEQALADYHQALRLDPKDVLSLEHRGVVHIALGRLERGLDDLNEALALAPGMASIRYQRGRAYLNGGAYQAALVDFDAALDLVPGFLDARLNRGVAFDRLEEYERAIADFDAVIAADPAIAGAYNNRGMSYAKQGKTDRAIADFDYAITLDPNLGGAYFNRAQAYYLKGDKTRAMADYIQARQLDRQFPEVTDEMFENFDIDIPNAFGRRRPFGL